MQESIADLYANIFLFLASIMDWISEKRFKRLLDSFSDSLTQRFDDEIKRIERKAEFVRLQAAQNSRAELRVTRLELGDLGRDVRIGLEANERYQAELLYHAQRNARILEEMQQRTRKLEEGGWQVVAPLVNAVKLLLENNASVWAAPGSGRFGVLPVHITANTEATIRENEKTRGKCLTR